MKREFTKVSVSLGVGKLGGWVIHRLWTYWLGKQNGNNYKIITEDLVGQ